MITRRLISFAVLVAALVVQAADNPSRTPTPTASREVRQCATCHPSQAKPHPATSMAHSMETVDECALLAEHPLLRFKDDSYEYTIRRDGHLSVYSVTDGRQTIEVPIGWAFGQGTAGQTYVYLHNGDFYESRLSFYKELNGLDFTMGANRTTPLTIVEALGRKLSSRESMKCFSCHATNAVVEKKLDVERMIAGVQCERCHGSTAAHVEGVRTGNLENAAMKKLSKLSTGEMNDFCGACHGAFSQISELGPNGVANVRFQPYRITNSKCYDDDDPRISCIACHDPHQELVRDAAASYDPKCRACHTGQSGAKAKTCPVAHEECASCHMPRIAIPGPHHKFADHRIRIVRANEPYPN